MSYSTSKYPMFSTGNLNSDQNKKNFEEKTTKLEEEIRKEPPSLLMFRMSTRKKDTFIRVLQRFSIKCHWQRGGTRSG